MVGIIEDRKEDLRGLCERFGVNRLDVFGSVVAEDRFDADRSDVDFLVEFKPTDPVHHAKAYLGLLRALEELFSRAVDLIEIRAVTNPYFLDSINRERRQIYAA